MPKLPIYLAFTASGKTIIHRVKEDKVAKLNFLRVAGDENLIDVLGRRHLSHKVDWEEIVQ